MKEKETKEKREIRLPKVVVYLVASIVTVILTVGVSFSLALLMLLTVLQL